MEATSLRKLLFRPWPQGCGASRPFSQVFRGRSSISIRCAGTPSYLWPGPTLTVSA